MKQQLQARMLQIKTSSDAQLATMQIPTVSSAKHAKMAKSNSFLTKKPTIAPHKKFEMDQYSTHDPKSAVDSKTKATFSIAQFQLYQSTQPKEQVTFVMPQSSRGKKAPLPASFVKLSKAASGQQLPIRAGSTQRGSGVGSRSS